MAGQFRTLKYPPASSARRHTGGGVWPWRSTQAPPPQDPPHGKDPRYWIDLGKIIYVSDGKLAPTNTLQIGPTMYLPRALHPGRGGAVTRSGEVPARCR